jgi:hypothetical protein
VIIDLGLLARPLPLFSSFFSSSITLFSPSLCCVPELVPSQLFHQLQTPSITYHTKPNQPLQLHSSHPTMSAAIEIATQPLSKVDSAIDDTPASPSESKIRHRRTSSTVSGVFNINELGE